MSGMRVFLWGALPYIALAVLIFGTLVRYLRFERGWTAKSSEFLEKKSLKWAGPIFHLGILMALGGHIIGVLIPKSVTEAMGVSEHVYHMVALGGGIPAGILFLGGFLMLMVRRFSKDRMAANTSGMDKWLYLALFLTIATGFGGTLLNAGGSFDYRETISPWFRSLLALSPDVSLMEGVPLIFRAHMLMWMTLAILFPFTRLVHCLSFPFSYFGRSPVVYREK